MKKILFTTLILLIFHVADAQNVTPTPSTKLTDKELGMQYLKKSKQLKLAGWGMLVSGMTMVFVGYAKAWEDGTGGGLALAGSFLTLGSIPCFIVGAKNKGRAEILLRNENMMVSLTPNSLKAVPSLTLAIKIK